MSSAEKRPVEGAEHIPLFLRPPAGSPLLGEEFQEFLLHTLREHEPPAFASFFSALRRGGVYSYDEYLAIPPRPTLAVLLDDAEAGIRGRSSVLIDTDANPAYREVPEHLRMPLYLYEHGFGYGEHGLIPLAVCLSQAAEATVVNTEELLERDDELGEIARAYKERAALLELEGRSTASDPEVRRLSKRILKEIKPTPVIACVAATPELERLLVSSEGATGLVGMLQGELDPELSEGRAIRESPFVCFDVRGHEPGQTFVWGTLSDELPATCAEAEVALGVGTDQPVRLSDMMSDNILNTSLVMFFRGVEAGRKAARRTHGPSPEARRGLFFASRMVEADRLVEQVLGPGREKRFTTERTSMNHATASVLRRHEVDAQRLMTLHQHGDWGSASEAEREENERVLAPLSVPEGGEPEPNPPGVVVSRFKPGHPALPEGYAGPELAVATVITEVDQWSCAVNVADRAALVEGIRAGQYLNPFASVDPEIDPHQAEGFPPIMPVGMLTAVFTPDAEAQAMKVLRDCQEHYTVPEEVLQEKAAEG